MNIDSRGRYVKKRAIKRGQRDYQKRNIQSQRENEGETERERLDKEKYIELEKE